MSSQELREAGSTSSGEFRRPEPPSYIYEHVNDRELAELQASTLYKIMRQLDRVIRLLETMSKSQDEILNASGDIADDIETITDLAKQVQIPSMFRKKAT